MPIPCPFVPPRARNDNDNAQLLSANANQRRNQIFLGPVSVSPLLLSSFAVINLFYLMALSMG
ncbi:hypothetical protein CONLIGDRAFT_635755 [Coniochaeta ligniaria NRRL 30616]|uniref:Uncharacterized protein n=1 Tax=Coniochaeta ligniaria NRRL 30616 TaxID=1408157 RepID=A0A1J7JEG9_9PEZI|nr:hypothetical protein CONLIGDRAFT_635755 [Coniochaeta ligniaria NRRL 30616]